MKNIIYTILFCALIPSCRETQRTCSEIEVNFSPNAGAEKAIVKEIDQAKSSINIQAYSFTSEQIGAALLAAHTRGVKVNGILDRENLGNPHSLLRPLSAAGLDFYLDGIHAIAHNKVMIIDDAVVITGSYNFTRAAQEKNAENSLIIKDKSIASQYSTNWLFHKDHSHHYTPDVKK
jgi:phosphatidylserine/phosphatidylglycerophosphate/cardiolipin synthase-like enzyme